MRDRRDWGAKQRKVEGPGTAERGKAARGRGARRERWAESIFHMRKGQGKRSKRERDEQRRERAKGVGNESNEKGPPKELERKREPSRARRGERCERIGAGGG